jgi:hypothetical protein
VLDLGVLTSAVALAGLAISLRKPRPPWRVLGPCIVAPLALVSLNLAAGSIYVAGPEDRSAYLFPAHLA